MWDTAFRCRRRVRHRPRTASRAYCPPLHNAISDGPPWNDPAAFDSAADTWEFEPWPGVAFALPRDE